MKSRRPHVVPLAQQAIEILRELQSLKGGGRFLFPGIRDRKRPMSDNKVNAALPRLGYSGDEMIGHGFRSIASTILREQGWSHEAIERQLAHGERDEVSRAYNFAQRREGGRLPAQRIANTPWLGWPAERGAPSLVAAASC